MGMGLHAREGVKEHDIHIKIKSYKLEILGELAIELLFLISKKSIY